MQGIRTLVNSVPGAYLIVKHTQGCSCWVASEEAQGGFIHSSQLTPIHMIKCEFYLSEELYCAFHEFKVENIFNFEVEFIKAIKYVFENNFTKDKYE